MKRAILFFLILLSLASIECIYGGNNVWTGHGPFVADFHKLVFSASNPKVGYGWTYSNFMRTTDGGSTWLHIRFPDNYGYPAALAIHPRNSNILYAARTSIYVSSDRGLHWRSLSSLMPDLPPEVSDLKIDRNHPNILYAATAGTVSTRSIFPGHLFKSIDSGKTWSLIFSNLQIEFDKTAAVELHPTNSSLIYSAFDRMLFRTTNGGINWKRIKIMNSSVKELKVSPFNGNVLYAVTYDRIWKSSNGGLHWFSTGGRCVPNLAMDPRNPEILYASGHIFRNYADCLQKSMDGGVTWLDLHIPRPSLYDDFGALATSRGGLYVSTDLLYRSFSGGTNWNFVIDNKGDDAEYGIRIDDGPASNLFAFRQQRLYFNKSGSSKWLLLSTPGQFTIWDLQIHPRDSTWIAAAGLFGVYPVTTSRSLLISRNTGKSWQFLSTPFRFTRRVLFHPMDLNKIFLIGDSSSSRTEFARSDDQGKTWKTSRIPVTGDVEWTSNPFVIYVAGGQDLAKSEDEGKTWKVLSKHIVSTYITSLALASRQTIYVAAANDENSAEVPVYKSTDGGVTWEKKTTFRGSFYLVKVHPTDPNIVFAGGEDGIFVSTDAGETWAPFPKNGVSGTPEIRALAISRAHPDILFGNFLTGVYSYRWIR